MIGFNRQRPSIARRLLVFSVVFVSAALIIASVILWFAIRTVVREQIDQRLDTQISALTGAVSYENGQLTLHSNLDGPPFDRFGSGWYWQVEGAGQRLTSRSLGQATIDAPPRGPDFRRFITGAPYPGEALDDEGRGLYTRQAIRNWKGLPIIITASAPGRALVDPALHALFWLLPCMAALGAVLVGGTFLQIYYGLKPLSLMASQIEAINKGERNRLPAQSIVELAPLADKTNDLLQLNEERLSATRLQFANLAHGLKTPTASLFLALNDKNDPDGDIRDLAHRIDRRIKHHLSSARRVMGGASNGVRTPIGPVVNELQQIMAKIYEERHIEIKTEGLGAPATACDEKDLEEMLGNLMENAIKWARRQVSVTAQTSGRSVLIVVEDDGPGIPDDRLKAVLLPGVREDERVPGDGFGLTIVSELAELYGGSLRLENRMPSGLAATLTLPSSM
ncbi:sensor histidine kinase [Oryzifoliimicrobium ureilyticus]|uniref:sensor histidine kinase n=1 Tax=Oryzifoliimicrobium ureilyticus TaxID=3113724 RepID=UPI00307651A0